MDTINNPVTRGECFRLLAACFYEPERSVFLEEQVAENLQSRLAPFSEVARQAAKRMHEGLLELSQETLSIDHAALFVGPFELLAPPYGSVYIEKKRTVMGDSTMFATRCYQEAGLSVEVKEPGDHIAIELEFMALLCGKEVEAVREDRAEEAISFQGMQNRFYHQAMAPWVDEFCLAVEAGTKNEFYLGLADCLKNFFAVCRQIYSTDPYNSTRG